MIATVTDENFQDEVINSSLPVLVAFGTPDCEACVEMEPVTVSRCKINYIPTFVFFKNGREMYSMLYVVPQDTLEEKLNSLL